jgi:carbon-monoxide dehydrogenase small subunit/xanthine dehydrogenase small subunit
VAEAIDIALAVNGRPRRLRVRTDQRLLDVLREDLRLTGAKEGCGKGECGSCTVSVNGRPIVSCLMMAFQADGTAVETIEGLADGAALDRLQEAFLDTGGAQCGICIPGMIMAGKAVLDAHPHPTPAEVREGLGGNLCRCTGYTKIFAAVSEAAARPVRPAAPRAPAPEPAAPTYYRPRSLEEALEILVQRGGELRPLAGGTDLLVAAKDGRRSRSSFFDLSLVPELSGIEELPEHVRIGALATHAEMAGSALLKKYAPALPIGCSWVGGPQIRNRGTLGGNLAHGSPAADTVPALYVADAVVEAVSVSDRREIPIAEFFTGPGKTVLASDELIVAVRIPKRAGVHAAFLRLGQRQAQAISKVSVAVAMSFRDGRPDWVRVALGSVAPTVIRAPRTEAALLGGGYDALKTALGAVGEEARPIDDLRSTREYRRAMTAVLLQRAIRRITEG